jgi:hypothetical protein
MAVETRVVAAVLWRRRLAARALSSVAETWRRRAVELVVAGLLQLSAAAAA